MASGEYKPEIHDDEDDVPLPERKSTYRAAFWGAFSGHVKGIASGIASGGFIGALVGVGIAAIAVLGFGAVIGTLGPLATFGVIAGGVTAAGVMTGIGIMSLVGTVAGAAAGVEDEKLRRKENALTHAREKEAAIASGMTPQQFEQAKAAQETTRREQAKRKPFRVGYSLKVGLVGLAMGALVGVALAASGGALPLLALAHLTLGPAATIGFSAAAMGVLGATFGIDCGVFRKITSLTDGIFRVKQGGAADCLPCHAKERGQSLAPSHLPAQVTLSEEEQQRLQGAQLAAISHQERVNTTAVTVANPGRA